MKRHDNDMNTTCKRHESNMKNLKITSKDMKIHENDMNTTCKRHESNMKIFENNIKRNEKT